MREKPDFDVLKRIEDERNARGWTEYTLAKNAGVTQSTISSWYRNGQMPSIATLEKICAAFGVTLSQFFRLDESCDETDEQREMKRLFSQLAPPQRNSLLLLLRTMDER